jgi:hypothetical protein
MNRRSLAGVALGASPVLVAASHFLWPAHSEGTDQEQIIAAGQHSGAWLAATVVETIGWLLLVPAVIEIWSVVRGRGRTLTGVGVWLTLLGVFGYFGAGLMNLVTIDLGRRHEPTAMASVMHSIKHDSALFWMLVAPLLLGTAAIVVLFAGVARARMIGWWAPLAAFLSIAASQVLSESDNALLLAAVMVPLIVAACVTGRDMVARRDQRAPSPFDLSVLASA